MKEKPKAALKNSVALCTFNGAAYLPHQLDSIRRQTVLPDELVIGDDCSTDKTISIIEKFAETAPFRVDLQINDKNLGSTKNFERTLQRCGGDLIFLCDQDDIWSEEKIERIRSTFEKNANLGLVFTNAALIDEESKPVSGRLFDFTFDKRRQKTASATEFYRTLLKGNVVTGATAAFRSKFVETVLPIPATIPNMIHDGWIALVVSTQSEVSYLDEPLIQYRLHRAQQMGISWPILGTRRFRFSKTVGFLKLQQNQIEALNATADTYPALRNGTLLKESVAEAMQETSENILHLERRLELYDAGASRLGAVVRELGSGRYHRFSKGFSSAVADLIYGGD